MKKITRNEKGMELIQVIGLMVISVVLGGLLLMASQGGIGEGMKDFGSIIGSIYDYAKPSGDGSGIESGSGGGAPGDYATNAQLEELRVKIEELAAAMNEAEETLANANGMIVSAEEKAQTAVDTAENAAAQADEKIDALQDQISNAETSLSATQTILMQSESVLNETIELLKTLIGKTTNIFTHNKTGTIHRLTGYVGDGKYRFISTANYQKGDTFTIDGKAVEAILQNGQQLSDNFFISGVPVECSVKDNVLCFYPELIKGNSSGLISVANDGIRPENPNDYTLWIDYPARSGKYTFMPNVTDISDVPTDGNAGDVFITNISTRYVYEIEDPENGLITKIPVGDIYISQGDGTLVKYEDTTEAFEDGVWTDLTAPKTIPNPTMLPGDTWYKSSVNRTEIDEINFVRELPYNAPGYTETWDASETQDGSITVARTSDNIIYISSNGADKIMANADSSYMFSDTAFNSGFKSLTLISGLEMLDTSKVTNMGKMFSFAGYNATNFSLDLSGWDTSNVTHMTEMFSDAGYNATNFSLDLSGWDTSNVTDTIYMFFFAGRNAKSWSIEGLSDWDTSNVTNMYGMFSYAAGDAESFSLNISGWNTSNVIDMSDMFLGAGDNSTDFNLDLSNWNTSSVTNMQGMFSEAGYNATDWSVGGLSSWDTSNVTNMQGMFSSAGCNATNFSLDISGWNTTGVTSVDDMFTGSGLANVSSSITVGTNVKRNVLDQLPTESGYAWINAAGTGYQPTEIPEGVADTYTLTKENPTILPQDTWNKSSAYNGDIKEIHFVTELPYNASGYAETWDASEKQDGSITCAITDDNIIYISSNGADKIIANPNSSYMFSHVVEKISASYTALTTIDGLNMLDVSKVSNMRGMFMYAGTNATSFSLDINGWDTSNVVYMNYMFYDAGYNATTWSIGEVSDWDISNVEYTEWMFGSAGYKATNFSLDISDWDTTGLISTDSMFTNSGLANVNSSITVGTNVKRNVLDQLPSDINRYAWRSKTTGMLYMKPTEIPEGVADTYEFLDLTGGTSGSH